MGTPNTTIHLCADVPLNNKYDHTLYFNDHASQLDYFRQKVKRTLRQYTYVRKTWTMKVDATMDEARVWSYLYFQNGDFGKRYFYFINQIEYKNENTVELFLELDVLQTYMMDWVLRPCYVEREHSKTDEIGENTVDEGLDVGEYLTRKKEICNLCNNIMIMCAATIDVNELYINGTVDKTLASNYDGIFGGYQITATNLANFWQAFGVMLNKIDEEGQSDAIVNLWHYPGELLFLSNGNFNDPFAKYVSGSRAINIFADGAPATIDGYAPKNKKLFQYPYCLLYVTNNQGGSAIYHYELMGDSGTGKHEFKVSGNIGADATVRLTPANYKGVDDNVDESLTISGFPLCAWNNDTYKLWLAQNQNSQNLGYAMGALKIVGGAGAILAGVATAGTGVGLAGIGAGVGMIGSGAAGIASQLAQKADREVQPPQSRGNPGGSHNLANDIHNFEFYHKTIDAVHARMIDDFFSLYGYAVRAVKTPSYKNRPYWNYIKTINSNITGNFAQEDINQINAIFDKGVTFWKTPDVGNYGFDNSPQ